MHIYGRGILETEYRSEFRSLTGTHIQKKKKIQRKKKDLGPGNGRETEGNHPVAPAYLLLLTPPPQVFPAVFQSRLVQHEVVAQYSHLFTVHGSDPSLQPYMLMAHIDVVPVSEEGWEVPPFSGLERNGFIHGRGALDNKNSVMVWSAMLTI